MLTLIVDRLWPGYDPGATFACVDLAVDEAAGDLVATVDARFAGDPAPPGPPRAFDGLWAFEVVEVFIVAAPFDPSAAYVELELSPHGHWLALALQGYRRRVRDDLPLHVAASIDGARWRAEARVPLAALPPRPWRVGAFALHGPADARRHVVTGPLGGDRPDFHRVWELSATVT